MTMAARPPSLPITGRLPPLEAGDRLDQPTFHARYEQMPPGIKAELIGGIVYMPSPVKNRHGAPHGEVLFCLNYYKAFTPGVATSDNGTTILGDDSEPQPDAFMRVETGGQTRLDAEDYVVGCPELVCEVANSSASYDLHVKRDDYERYGALEYLAAVVREERVARFARQGNRLVEVPPDADGVLRSTAFPGFWLDPAALLRGDTKRLMDVLNQGIATPEHAAFTASLASRNPIPPGP
jgi:Uma2 family endonuclease